MEYQTGPAAEADALMRDLPGVVYVAGTKWMWRSPVDISLAPWHKAVCWSLNGGLRVIVSYAELSHDLERTFGSETHCGFEELHQWSRSFVRRNRKQIRERVMNLIMDDMEDR